MHASFGAHHENLNEDRRILSATKMYPSNSRFWQCKVYADIRGGSQDLCKFSLDLRMPVSIYTGMICLSRGEDFVVR